MSRNKLLIGISSISLVILIVSVVAFNQLATKGSVLSFSQSKNPGTLDFEGPHQVFINQQFSLKILIDSNKEHVNAAGLYLRFDPEKIQITEISTLSSFCQFYPEKKFDNRMGIVSLACGAPHPGFNGKGELIELKINPIAIGTSTIRVTSSSKLLVSDGKGTNILDSFPSWEVQTGVGL